MVGTHGGVLRFAWKAERGMAILSAGGGCDKIITWMASTRVVMSGLCCLSCSSLGCSVGCCIWGFDDSTRCYAIRFAVGRAVGRLKTYSKCLAVAVATKLWG